MNEREIFDAAVVIDNPSERRVYLERACSGDADLVAHIENLVGAHQRLGNFLVSPPNGLGGPPPRVDATAHFEDPLERVGAQIGPYRLMEQIGEGGMGVVYVARQDRPMLREVALKIIKPGMDTKEVIARFEAERQALAMMDHPNIAKVLDAGATESGRPYFAMELVRGIPITKFCDGKRLATRERLALFVSTCQAIQHAHQKGVIHRDVKPSNVLVAEHDGTPLPKVIDFGVAKATNQRLTERTIYTRHQQMIGTPLYMSPEQADLSALDVDTRSDIYSLGVLLYELLTGVTPFDQTRFKEAAYDEMRRIIREEDPPKPSTRISSLGISADAVTGHRQTDPRKLRQALRGELDWIVMKALEKDRSRRYETANGLAADVDRYLRNEAVRACPPSVMYRFRKLARRNQVALLTTTAFGAVLLLATIFSTWQAGVARDDRDRAEKARGQANDDRIVALKQEERARIAETRARQERDAARNQQQRAESVLNLMKRMLSSASLSAENPRDYTVHKMLDDFSETIDESEDNREVRADIWHTIGNVYFSIEEMVKASDALERGLELAREAYQNEPDRLAGHLISRGWNLISLGHQELNLLHTAEAEALLREALDISQQPESKHGALVYLSLNKMFRHEFEEMETIAKQAIELEEFDPRLGGAGPLCLGAAIWKQDDGREQEAIDSFDKGIPALYKLLAESERTNVERSYAIRRGLGDTLACKAYVLFELGRVDEADRYLEECLDLWKVGSQYATRLCVDPECVRAWSKLRIGKRGQARKILERILLECQTAKRAPLEAEVLHYLARMALLDGAPEDAESRLRRAVAVCRAAHGDNHIHTVRATIWLAQHLELFNRGDEAASILERLRPVIERLVEQSDRNAEWVARLALAKSHAANSTNLDLADSEVLAREALRRIPRIGAYFPRYVNTLPPIALAKAQIRSGAKSDAIQTLRQGLADRHPLFVYEWFTVEAWLLELLEAQGNAADFGKVLRDAVEYRERILTADHPATLRAKQRLAEWLAKRGSAVP